MGTVTSHYCRGYYCTNIHPWIAVDQFHIETFSPGNEEKKKETTHKYISWAWKKETIWFWYSRDKLEVTQQPTILVSHECDTTS